jgi:hypothetical protein
MFPFGQITVYPLPLKELHSFLPPSFCEVNFRSFTAFDEFFVSIFVLVSRVLLHYSLNTLLRLTG